jgi:hypothetical protein
MSEYVCPRCQATVDSLVPVDANLRQKFSVVQEGAELPHAICASCMSEVKGVIGQTSASLARVKTREDSKQRLWRSRVTLLKKARILMKKKAFGEAILNYEKYIKILETVFEVNEEGLKPEIFKERMATKELTIITSAYWDLLRVYDTNEKYRQRMIATSNKLIQFAPFTPITLDIVKKAEAYKKQARNPDIFKTLIRELMYKRNHCFIATSVFEDPRDWFYTEKLRVFRDQVLARTVMGRRFVASYYSWSPGVARILDAHPLIKGMIRIPLKLIAKAL